MLNLPSIEIVSMDSKLIITRLRINIFLDVHALCEVNSYIYIYDTCTRDLTRAPHDDDDGGTIQSR
jgi:hypothetical protein